MAHRVRHASAWFLINIRYIPMDNTPLHLLPNVGRPWDKDLCCYCRYAACGDSSGCSELLHQAKWPSRPDTVRLNVAEGNVPVEARWPDR